VVRAQNLREAEGYKYSSNLLSMLQGGVGGGRWRDDGGIPPTAPPCPYSEVTKPRTTPPNKGQDDPDDDEG